MTIQTEPLPNCYAPPNVKCFHYPTVERGLGGSLGCQERKCRT